MSRCRRCAPVPPEVRRAAGLLEGRWTVSILWASYAGASRFNEFREAVTGIPPGTLAHRLAQLEDAGVLERVVVSARPQHVEYRLTTDGRRLRSVIEGLVHWGARGRAGGSGIAGPAPGNN